MLVVGLVVVLVLGDGVGMVVGAAAEWGGVGWGGGDEVEAMMAMLTTLFVLSCIAGVPVKLEKNVDHHSRGDIENPVNCITSGVVEAKKRMHSMFWEVIQNFGKIFSLPLVQVTSIGIHEIVEAILRSYPDAISLKNQKKQSIFHQAIVYRHEKVFNLIRQVEESRTIFLSKLDESKNNALHLAGYMAPQQQLYLRVGAALQMQRELHWFKVIFPDPTGD
ncbi:hypothetical protein TEA_002098 [Camellia sinensis var. sinensis]|uniref:Uncharacterized protein n=1 Tax=Camellia sinensis var. sinensis TaxID=542762 RepID=A0A4S4E621_CAMSN|nr:hypothetical protein TEA_002098 [Camellia sinensis var. sinensis]